MNEYLQWLADWQARDNELKAQENDMKVGDVYSGSSFLKAEDLQGKTVSVTIGDIGTHAFNKGEADEKTQIVLSFIGKEKKLGLNNTNVKTIEAQMGDETDMWIGQSIKLYPTMTDFGGREVACIRIVQEMPPEAGTDDIPVF